MIDSVPQVGPADPTQTKTGQETPQGGSQGGSQNASPGAPQGSGAKPAAPGSGESVTRLYVEQDGTGVYVYRLVDTVTGRLLAEVPRERADELKTSPDYAAGDILKTSA